MFHTSLCTKVVPIYIIYYNTFLKRHNFTILYNINYNKYITYYYIKYNIINS